MLIFADNGEGESEQSLCKTDTHTSETGSYNVFSKFTHFWCDVYVFLIHYLHALVNFPQANNETYLFNN